MPVTRRKSSNRALIGNSQPTLTFNSRSARVTKPTVEHTSKLTKKAAAKVDSIVSDEQTIPPSPLTTEEEVALAVRSNEEETEAERAVEETEAGRQARKITAVQIKKYWRAKEDERKAPRVHQSGLTVHDKVLRHFDLSSQYGPCIGIARHKRWLRAAGLGLNPPIEVLAVLMKEEAKEGPEKMQRAYVDELMSSKFVVGGKGDVVDG